MCTVYQGDESNISNQNKTKQKKKVTSLKRWNNLERSTQYLDISKISSFVLFDQSFNLLEKLNNCFIIWVILCIACFEVSYLSLRSYQSGELHWMAPKPLSSSGSLLRRCVCACLYSLPLGRKRQHFLFCGNNVNLVKEVQTCWLL